MYYFLFFLCHFHTPLGAKFIATNIIRKIPPTTKRTIDIQFNLVVQPANLFFDCSSVRLVSDSYHKSVISNCLAIAFWLIRNESRVEKILAPKFAKAAIINGNDDATGVGTRYLINTTENPKVPLAKVKIYLSNCLAWSIFAFTSEFICSI